MAKSKNGGPLAALNKKYNGAIKTGLDLFEDPDIQRGVISISPSLDLALGGGVKEGSWVIISGDPKQGKSTSVLHLLKNAIDDKRQVVYFDVENRLDTQLMSTIMGLEPEALPIVSPVCKDKDGKQIGKVITAEEYLSTVEALCQSPDFRGGVIAIDSLSAMICKAEATGELSGTTRSGLPKLISQFCKRVSPVARANRVTLVFVTHLIADTGPSMRTKMPDCGRKIQYQADTNIEIAFTKAWKEGSGDNERRIGHTIKWRVICSAMGASPGTECDSYLRYGKGLDTNLEMVHIACDLGLITAPEKGSWYTVDFLDDQPKVQGINKVKSLLEENPEYMSLLKENIKEMLCPAYQESKA